jgi:hypothetical protein
MPANHRTQSTLLGVLSGYRRTFHGFLAQLPSNSIFLFQKYPFSRPIVRARPLSFAHFPTF